MKSCIIIGRIEGADEDSLFEYGMLDGETGPQAQERCAANARRDAFQQSGYDDDGDREFYLNFVIVGDSMQVVYAIA